MAPTRSAQVMVRLTRAELMSLKELADKQERSVSQIVRFAIRQYVQHAQVLAYKGMCLTADGDDWAWQTPLDAIVEGGI